MEECPEEGSPGIVSGNEGLGRRHRDLHNLHCTERGLGRGARMGGGEEVAKGGEEERERWRKWGREVGINEGKRG